VIKLNKVLEKAVKQYKNGNNQAFETIYNETKKNVYYTILLIIKDRQITEELMQDTYMRMIENIDKYKDKQTFNAWLSTMAKNLAINHYHKMQREQIIDVQDNPFIFGETHEQNEDQYFLNQLLKTLPKDEQEIVVRHVVLEQKHREIADIMKIPLGTVTWKYQEALKKLKSQGGDGFEK